MWRSTFHVCRSASTLPTKHSKYKQTTISRNATPCCAMILLQAARNASGGMWPIGFGQPNLVCVRRFRPSLRRLCPNLGPESQPSCADVDQIWGLARPKSDRARPGRGRTKFQQGSHMLANIERPEWRDEADLAMLPPSTSINLFPPLLTPSSFQKKIEQQFNNKHTHTN